MADTTGKEQNAIWPLPKFKFKVTFAVNGYTMSFSEVSGLDAEAQIIEYRHGDSSAVYPLKMPGIQKFNNCTLKRGVFVGDNTFFDWWSQINMNTIKNGRETITIQLLNQADNPTMTWELQNAWPTKVTSTDMKSDANEAAIEQMEIAFENIVISNENNAS